MTGRSECDVTKAVQFEFVMQPSQESPSSCGWKRPRRCEGRDRGIPSYDANDLADYACEGLVRVITLADCGEAGEDLVVGNNEKGWEGNDEND